MAAALFLIGSLMGAWRTWNAKRPPHAGRVGPLWLPALLTGELALHQIAWQAVATALFIWWGALDSWLGWTALTITAASWAGLVVLFFQAGHAKHVVGDALDRPRLAARVRARVGRGVAEHGDREHEQEHGHRLEPADRCPLGRACRIDGRTRDGQHQCPIGTPAGIWRELAHLPQLALEILDLVAEASGVLEAEIDGRVAHLAFEGADQALSKNGEEMQGRKIVVSVAKERDGGRGGGSPRR